MKKIIIAVALMLTTGILASQTKVNSVKSASVTLQKFSISSEKKDLASAD